MINLHKPFLSKSDFASLESSIKSGWVSSAGPMIEKFENKISKYTGSKNVIACSSGTAALHIALKIMGFNKNQEIIVPSLTFVASINSIIYNNLSPFFIDSNKFYTINEENLFDFFLNFTKKVKINNKNFLINIKTAKVIRAILLVHTFGNAVAIEKIYNFCKKNNIVIIEDAAESLGTFYSSGKFKNYHTGTIGTIGCLSFNGNKIITTGSGGAILTNNNALAKKAKYYINQSKDDNIFYIHNDVGYNYRMNNLQASLGYSQINKLEKIINLKNKIHNLYKKNFTDKNLTISNTPDFCNSNNWLNILEIKHKYSKYKLKKLIKELEKKRIQTRPLWYPNHLQKPFLKFNNHKIKYFNNIYYNRLCLPSSPDLTPDNIKYISKQIKSLILKI